MPAGCKKLVSVVKGCPLWPEHDEKFLSKTEDALLCSGVETLAPSYNLPGYLVGDVLGF